jgi:ribosomal protein L22
MAEKKRKTEQAEVEGKAAAAKEEAAVAEAEAEKEEVDEPSAPSPQPPEAEDEPRRRGSAETSAPAQKRAAPRQPDGSVVIRARSKYVRSAPRKARLVMDHIRGKPVEQALSLLAHTPRAASADVLKLLNSAIANAESNYELAPDELRVERAYVDEGPIIKRYRPRALGRATRINKRTSHMTIELKMNEEGG